MSFVSGYIFLYCAVVVKLTKCCPQHGPVFQGFFISNLFFISFHEKSSDLNLPPDKVDGWIKIELVLMLDVGLCRHIDSMSVFSPPCYF